MSMLTYQDIVALALVGWAVGYVAWRVWRFAFRAVPTGCLGCKGCAAAQQPALISLGGLGQDAGGLRRTA